MAVGSGLCACGCGLLTVRSRYSSQFHHRVAGQPVLFRWGHNGRRPIEERLWSKIEPEPMSGCWIWVGSRDSHGYGRMMLSSVGPIGAHRVTYEHYRGPIGDGLELDHLCGLPSCVNPWHLESVTHLENMRRGWWASRPACKNGHLFSRDNTGRHHEARRCLTCHRQEERRRHANRGA